MFGQQLLEMGLDAVLDESRVDAQFVFDLRHDLCDGDDERGVGLLLSHGPDLREAGFDLVFRRFVDP